MSYYFAPTENLFVFLLKLNKLLYFKYSLKFAMSSQWYRRKERREQEGINNNLEEEKYFMGVHVFSLVFSFLQLVHYIIFYINAICLCCI